MSTKPKQSHKTTSKTPDKKQNRFIVLFVQKLSETNKKGFFRLVVFILLSQNSHLLFSPTTNTNISAQKLESTRVHLMLFMGF